MRDIRELKGVGEARAKLFAKKNIKTVEDLLYFFPRDYEDRTKMKMISACEPGETVCVKAAVFSAVREVRIRKNMTIYSAIITDETGGMSVVWYNNPYVKNAFESGKEYIFCGKIQANHQKRELVNPIYERADHQRYTGRIVPVYPLTGTLTQRHIQSAMEQAITTTGRLTEYLPEEIRQKYQLAELNFAMQNIHFPADFQSYNQARRRFVFEELLILQLALLGKKTAVQQATRKPFTNTDCWKEFVKKLPFQLTGAQERVLGEIAVDFQKNIPMSRLVQGDVGSGKTAVAAAAMYVAVQNGYQAVIMAPTEILATQHFETFSAFFENTGINLCLLTGSTKKKKDVYKQIADGKIQIVIGTHAVIQKEVQFQNLGLVVADEQHRFGVSQRAALVNKGENPHVLIMTATPIPRTLAFILYGDLDISIIDELPPGRKPVATYAVGESMRKRIYAFLEKNLAAGMQCYVVCPLIAETEKSDLKNAENIMLSMQRIFPTYTVGLLHGKMKAAEKEMIMTDFAAKKIDILVSTTVIEVGVNVPNSNVMIIENAERFGLSQLHQLRGRVGRGGAQAYCILFAHGNGDVVRKRMETMCTSNDGFYISEQDLRLRGPGDFFGTRQHGLPDLKIANLFQDMEMLKDAQTAAADLLQKDRTLSMSEHIGLQKKVAAVFSEEIVMH